MSKRNDYNYFDLDNFDESVDSNYYRRRQPQRRQGSYNRRPVYSTGRRPKRRNRKRTRNRIIIVSCAILMLILIIVLLSVMFKGCSNKRKEALASVSTETKSTQTSESSSADQLPDELSPQYFVTPQIKDDKTNGESVYGIYVWNNTGFELFGNDETKAVNYAETVNGFADKLGSGITVYDMVVPNHTEMGLPQRLKNGDAPSGSQADNIKTVYANLSDKVTPVNCYNYLAGHNDEYIYFNTDHHWTGLGSYYAYKAFADTVKIPPLSLNDCTEHEIEGFTGSFSATADNLTPDIVHYWEFPYSVTMDITGDDGTVNTYDGSYYQYAEAGSNTYGVFIIGDNPLTVLKSESEKAAEGKKIAVVKESYGNAFVPYLTYNYDEVHVIDFRYFSQNLVAYCKQNGIDEVLFINGVMSANTQIQLDSMSSLFK